MQTFKNFNDLLVIKRYSENTIKTYLGTLKAFQKYIGYENSIEHLEESEIIRYVMDVVKEKKLAYTTHKQLLAALKLYYKELFSREIHFSAVYPRNKPKPLPVILSNTEVKSILEALDNSKHKAMLTLIYALGLRSGELINLKITDIHKQRAQVHIKSAKGEKDRLLPFPASLKPILTIYYKQYRPKEYLFNGQNNIQYSRESLRKVFRLAVKKAGIKKEVTLHSLRHAYATHLMESGINVRVIQELLGHNSIRTTMIYTHVTNTHLNKIPSPFDML